VWGPIRFFADVLGGGSHIIATLERDGLPTQTVRGWLPLGAAAAGIQVRLLHHLSLGFRAKMVFTDDELGGLRTLVGSASPVRTSVALGLTCHF
jgi:hypothetical protein